MKLARFSGKNLLRARKAAKISRFTLSKKIDFEVQAQTIAIYESGARVPSFNVAIRLAQALKIPLKDLTDAES